MSLQSRITMLIFGLLIWIGGTIYYAYAGPRVLETTQRRYWISFFVSAVASTLLSLLILKLQRIAPSQWAQAALLLALPGMVGEALVLSHLSTFMPRIQESSGGRYGAFLFASYAMVLGMAAIVTMMSTP